MEEGKNIQTQSTPQPKAAGKSRMGTGRFFILIVFLAICGCGIIGKALQTMLTQRTFWEEVRERFTKSNIIDEAIRGNIYDCNGRLLVGSVPEYQLLMDFEVIDKTNEKARLKTQAWRDSAFVEDVDSIAEGLHAIFPNYSVQFLKERLETGFRLKKNGWSILPGHLATFIEYKECTKLPLLRERSYRGGFHGYKIMKRKKPYGSLASRTLGSLRTDSVRLPKNGLELAYDSILRGKDGIKHNTKIRNARVDFSDKAAIDGRDIVTTIDVDIQDAAEKAILAQLKNLEAEMGIVVVMEAKTGDVKALVNMGRLENGQYAEIMNYAVAERMEPGSTFKTASIMVALEDGVIDKNTMIDTGSGVWMLHGRPMKDWGWSTRGGFGVIDTKTVMEQSSNIGVSRLIDEHYYNCPEKFVQGLERVGAGIPLDLEIPGAMNPIMKKDPKNDRVWWKTTLPWMSIGYESLLPPISTCAFYNGIANHGKLLKPRFMKAVTKDGVLIREEPVTVLREKMCSDKTLADIYEILENVVSAPNGTGKKARCPFKVCGKTGTAQIAVAGGGGYHSGTTRYLISFCGFFPAENPQYTCLVCIRKYGLPASGGGHCGPVFAQIAQSIMASGINHRIPQHVCDSNSVMMPNVISGSLNETQLTLSRMKLPFNVVDTLHTTQSDKQNKNWCHARLEGERVSLYPILQTENQMPDVTGMGARDAVYALQQVGVKAKLHGAGRVRTQSIQAGTVFQKGIAVDLHLE